MKETAIVLVIEIVVVALSLTAYKKTIKKDSKKSRDHLACGDPVYTPHYLPGIWYTFCRHAICSNRLHHSSILPSVARISGDHGLGLEANKRIYRKEGQQMNTIWSIIGAVFLLLLSLLGIQTKRVGKQKEKVKQQKARILQRLKKSRGCKRWHRLSGEQDTGGKA